MHFAHSAAMPEDQTGAAPGLDRQALRHRTGQDRQSRAPRDRIEIGGRGAVTARARDAELVPGRAGGSLAADVGIEWKAPTDRCSQERRSHGIAVRRVLERQDVLRAVAAVPVVGSRREGLGAPEIRQQVQKAPAGAAGGDPPVIVGCVAVLVGEGIDRARAAEHLTARIRHDTSTEIRLPGGHVAPIDGAPGELRPVRGDGNLGQVGLAAGLEQEHAEVAYGREAVRENAASRPGADDDDVIERSRQRVGLRAVAGRCIRSARAERAERGEREARDDAGDQSAASIDPLALEIANHRRDRFPVPSIHGESEGLGTVHCRFPQIRSV